MKIVSRDTRPVVIQLPREIDASNALDVAAQIRAEYRPDRIVVADMAKVRFCDSLGTRELLNVHYWAIASRCELRIARPSAGVRRVWNMLGADRIFVIFPSIKAAKGSASRPQVLS